jgi:hypothetical protein
MRINIPTANTTTTATAAATSQSQRREDFCLLALLSMLIISLHEIIQMTQVIQVPHTNCPVGAMF